MTHIFRFPYQPLHFHVGTDLSLVQTPRGICVGKPAPHVELKTDGDDSIGIGKILTRCPHLMIGYWHQVRSSVSNSHSWFDTGDVGFTDEHGQAWLIGLESGRIKTGGENVYLKSIGRGNTVPTSRSSWNRHCRNS
ncbi:hypothetical protein EUGRSUZ_D00163 [Eucalyptus grandis]|uniref:Uncharacterized protein n=2 Tax=Eucalyptus grandis TaxID=71139 RepID=A0ACC3L2R8_EUCGR|nr:hypothetical protein EUGRSUZ_D00163 [Eucalyptus grandis]